MTAKERAEHNRLGRLWATRRATPSQIRRCMELDRKSAHEARAAASNKEPKS